MLLSLPACRSDEAPCLDPTERALLRLEYLERAEKLPALKFSEVRLPVSRHRGRFSPVLWRIRSDRIPGRELFRPLPLADPERQLYSVLSRSLEEYGFDVRGASGQPQLRLRVDVERLLLTSENGPRDLRGCELSLLFSFEDNPSGLEVASFESSARIEIPGSWTLIENNEPVWNPAAPEDDPVNRAAIAAVEGFLMESLDFWRHPANWREGDIRLSAKVRP